MPEKRERVFNTRQANPQRKKPKPQPKSVVTFCDYASAPDADGVIHRHLAPVNYYCKTLRLFVNAGAGKIRLSVNNEDHADRDLEEGENIFQVERIVPEGSRITLKLLDGTPSGFWIAWVGEAT